MTENASDNQNLSSSDAIPDEYGTMYVQGFLRIIDPETQEILLESRS